MRVRAKYNIRHRGLVMEWGEEREVEELVGRELVGEGWAVDLETGENNEPVVGEVTLEVQDCVTFLKED